MKICPEISAQNQLKRVSKPEFKIG